MNRSNPQPGSREWRTIPQAAEYAGVTQRTIENWIAQGKLRAYKAGPRLVRIDLADVDEFMRPIAAGSGS